MGQIPEDVVGGEAEQAQKPEWSMSDERAFVENLVCTRFNFFLLFFSLVIGGMATISNPLHFKIVLALGSVISFGLALAIFRAQIKLEIALKRLSRSKPQHPAHILDQEAKKIKRWWNRSTRKLIGCCIPSFCCVVLIMLALLAVLGYLDPVNRGQEQPSSESSEGKQDSDASGAPRLLSDIGCSVAAGLVTSVVLGGLAFWYSRHRNKKLEREICESLRPDGFTYYGKAHYGFCIKNSTSHPVVIRSVRLRGGRDGSECLLLEIYKQLSPKGTLATERGWVELPPDTEANWASNFRADPRICESILPLKSVEIVLQYKTLLGETRIVVVQPRLESHRRFMLERFEEAITGRRPFAS